MMTYLTEEKIQPIPRTYYPADFDITNWDTVEQECQKLLALPVDTTNELIQMLERSTELGLILQDEMSWRYIRMTIHADDESYEKLYNEFYAGIYSRILPYNFELQKRYYHSAARKQLNPAEYGHLDRIISNYIELYREENIPLRIRETELSAKYGAIFGKMTVTYEGKEYTLTQLAPFMKNLDRKVRETVWRLRMERMYQDREALDELFDELRSVRMQIAKNAGYDNYRDYKHQEMGRFGYTPQDLETFHTAVEKTVLPFLKKLTEHRRQVLGLDNVKPWDTSVDLDGKILKPFETIDEFVSKAITILDHVDHEYALQLNKMLNSGLLDLENRKGKAPGGYNSGIHELGSSFIFMNAVKLHRDVVTLLHESGHAMHSMFMKDIPIDYYREIPSEVAELASMSMELLTMDYWNEYYPESSDLKKAKRDQLEGTLAFMPWCMIVDAFQQWIYTHPEHTADERADYFVSLAKRFDTDSDWSGLEELRKVVWMFQLHIFEVPFYYIEYGMAQLGALAIYRNYRQNPDKAVTLYQQFLQLGYTKPVNEIYEAAGIEFNFTERYLQNLVDFVISELANI